MKYDRAVKIRARRLSFLVLTGAVLLQLSTVAARAQSPPPPPTPPGTGGVTIGSVRVQSGNDLARNPGQENQPPVWLTIESKGNSAAAVLTVGNATKQPLDFSHTIVISFANSVRPGQVLVSVGTAVIQGNQVIWNGFSLAAGQIQPAIISLAGNGTAPQQPATSPAITQVSIEAKDTQTGAVVTELVAGTGPTVAVVASAPAAGESVPAAQTNAGTSVTPFSQAEARTFGTGVFGAFAVILLGLVIIAVSIPLSNHRLQRELLARVGVPAAPRPDALPRLESLARLRDAEAQRPSTLPPLEQPSGAPQAATSVPSSPAVAEAVAASTMHGDAPADQPAPMMRGGIPAGQADAPTMYSAPRADQPAAPMTSGAIPADQADAPTMYGASPVDKPAAPVTHGAVPTNPADAPTMYGASAADEPAAPTMHGAIPSDEPAAPTMHGAVPPADDAAAPTIHGALPVAAGSSAPPAEGVRSADDTVPSAPQAGPIAPVGMLRAQTGTEAGRRWILEDPETSIGRNESNSIVLADRTVSDRHARLVRQPNGRYLLADSGSRNGTFFNDQLVAVPVELQAGDTFRIGTTTFLFSDAM